MKVRTTFAIGLAALALTSCSSKAVSSQDGTGADGVKTGKGVTKDKITLGALTDLTGVYATLGKSITQAQQLYFEQLNAAGGVCGRKVDLLVRDHGYDVQKGVSAYSEVQPKVAGITQLIGSPVLGAVLPNLERDKLLVIPAAWPSSVLKEKYVQVVGSTYEIEVINGIDFLVRKKGLAKGAKVGHVYFEGEYGESALKGAKHAAAAAGLTIVEQRIKPTDTDMTSQVSALKAAGVKAIVLSAGPKQAASLAGVAAASGLDVPIVSNNPGFAPQLLGTAAGPALQKNFYLVNGLQASSSNVPGIKALVAAYGKKYPGQTIDNGVSFGYVSAKVFGEALKDACKAKDLTREGILAAHRTHAAFDSDGIAPKLDFSQVGKIGTLESFVQKPDAKAAGGLTTVEGPFTAEAAKTFTVG
ncbi:ABC transporter substrate-binding protein [Actinomadura macrotermitis]|uniref:Leucine-binding protein domain-containing protein n=1 Tax=Actinomadura macrotermitis TaxID=2585200 RepID=A0A7K0C2R4_9ACTN|nr:hypothetical protein [Actinomadura macrotermitis]